MVKLFVVVVGVVAFVVVGGITAVFGPLITGAANNLGGHPTLPFDAPVPQFVLDWINGAQHDVTLAVLLYATLALVALLFTSAISTLVFAVVRRAGGPDEAWAKRVAHAEIVGPITSGIEPSHRAGH